MTERQETNELRRFSAINHREKTLSTDANVVSWITWKGAVYFSVTDDEGVKYTLLLSNDETAKLRDILNEEIELTTTGGEK